MVRRMRVFGNSVYNVNICELERELAASKKKGRKMRYKKDKTPQKKLLVTKKAGVSVT